MATVQNPFAFKPYDEKMKAENAPNYITPEKRRRIKEYLSNSSMKQYALSGSKDFINIM